MIKNFDKNFEYHGHFTAREWQRYQRQISVAEFGVAGQLKLRDSTVVIIGMGGLGCPVAQYLTGAGIGNLVLVDGDHVERSNLHRQVIYVEDDISKPKALAATDQLISRNPDITINSVCDHLSVTNAEQIIGQADLVVDCTDNFAARYLINDTCHRLKKPWISAAVMGSNGQLAIFTPGKGCYRCLYPNADQSSLTCNDAGVLGIVPGWIGLAQATEVVKFLTGKKQAANQLLLFDLSVPTVRTVQLSFDENCVCQGGSGVNKNAQEYADDYGSAQASPIVTHYTGADSANALLIDVRNKTEHHAFNLGGINIPLCESDEFTQTVMSAILNQPEKKILFYCQTGRRSQQAANFISNRVRRPVHHLDGGIEKYLTSLEI